LTSQDRNRGKKSVPLYNWWFLRGERSANPLERERWNKGEGVGQKSRLSNDPMAKNQDWGKTTEFGTRGPAETKPSPSTPLSEKRSRKGGGLYTREKTSGGNLIQTYY